MARRCPRMSFTKDYDSPAVQTLYLIYLELIVTLKEAFKIWRGVFE